MPLLDRPVTLNSELLCATYGLRTNERRTVYADVPLSAIVGLFHKNFVPEATTWRGLLDGLHGQGWGPETLAYFESAIGDTHFPAPAAAHALILRAYGGAVVCVNGMHRLVAAVCWMAARDGAHARLQKVELQVYGIKAAAVAAMLEAAEQGAAIDAAYDGNCETVLIRAQSPRGARYWRIQGNTVSPTPAPGGWRDALRRRAGLRPRAEAGLHWQCVSETVLAALADDQWLRSQLAHPRYDDEPR